MTLARCCYNAWGHYYSPWLWAIPAGVAIAVVVVLKWPDAKRRWRRWRRGRGHA